MATPQKIPSAEEFMANLEAAQRAAKAKMEAADVTQADMDRELGAFREKYTGRFKEIFGDAEGMRVQQETAVAIYKQSLADADVILDQNWDKIEAYARSLGLKGELPEYLNGPLATDLMEQTLGPKDVTETFFKLFAYVGESGLDHDAFLKAAQVSDQDIAGLTKLGEDALREIDSAAPGIKQKMEMRAEMRADLIAIDKRLGLNEGSEFVAPRRERPVIEETNPGSEPFDHTLYSDLAQPNGVGSPAVESGAVENPRDVDPRYPVYEKDTWLFEPMGADIADAAEGVYDAGADAVEWLYTPFADEADAQGAAAQEDGGSVSFGEAISDAFNAFANHGDQEYANAVIAPRAGMDK